MKRFFALSLLFVVTACGDSPRDLVAPDPASQAARASDPGLASQDGPSDWIVVFRPGVADPPGLARRLTAEAGGTLRFTYEHTIQGFAATLPPQSLEGLRNNPNVERIEPDAEVHLVTEEPAASWGLDRVDQRSGLSGTYVYETQGAGVRAYILDTGIRTTHVDFGGRALRSSAADFIGGDGNDCHGHGTHVAGTVGGTTYGIAKAVELYAVRVLDCDGSGSLGGVIAGVDWVTADHNGRGGASVANMSLSAALPAILFPTLNEAVAASVDAGVVYAVAASNENTDACDYIPASEPKALTVGATSSSDARAYFSNYGTCLDLFAPGVSIKSAHSASDVATATWSGTSMASPHVAGVAALVLGDNPSADAATVQSLILDNATNGVVTNPGAGSPNKLLYSLITDGPPPPPENPPADPTGLSATAASESQIDLSWSHDGVDVQNFVIDRSSDGSSWGFLAQVGAAARSYSDMGLGPSETWFYRVQATNAVGPSGWSNTASATTDAEPPPAEDDPMEVWEISSPTETTQDGKFQYGTVGVTVTGPYDAFGLPTFLPGVTVQGDWYRDGDTQPVRSSSAVTNVLGIAFVESGRIKNPPSATLYFCVTSLSAAGYQDVTEYPSCNGGFTPPDPGDPGDPGTPGVPSNLTASWSNKGGGRVELSWTPGGGAEVDVFRGGTVIDTTSDNGRYNDRGGAVGDQYVVCVAGDPTKCSNPATAG